MRFRNMMKWAGILSVLLLCTACGTAQKAAETTTAETTVKATENGELKNYLRCEGTTAVVTRDSTLTGCFTLHENDSSETGKITQMDADNYQIAAGETVLLLHEDSQNPDMVHVMIPNDNTPHVYGYVAKENLSTDNLSVNIDQSVKDTDTWNR